jgi:hypothetical protein
VQQAGVKRAALRVSTWQTMKQQQLLLQHYGLQGAKDRQGMSALLEKEVQPQEAWQVRLSHPDESWKPLEQRSSRQRGRVLQLLEESGLMLMLQAHPAPAR